MPTSARDKEIDQLITSINEGAQAARTVVFGVLLVSLTMAAMIVGTSDDVILRNSIGVAPTLGVSVSALLAHLFAPIVLLFLHVNALVQLDLLGARIVQFRQLLHATVPVDSDRRHHLARVNSFALQFFPDQERKSASRYLLRTMSWLGIVGIPVTIMLVMQIGFLRYQSDWVTWVQRIALSLEVAVLAWFLYRKHVRQPSFADRWTRYGNPLALGLVVFASFGLAWPVSGERMAKDVRWRESHVFASHAGTDTTPRQRNDTFAEGNCSKEVTETVSWIDRNVRPVFKGCNAIDIYLCPMFDWGCRYIRLSNTVQVIGQAPVSQVGNFTERHPYATSAQLRTVGLRLRGRKLRFADFKDALLYGADLIATDLRSANLEEAHLQGAWFDGADLRGAVLDDAYLNGASFYGSLLSGAALQEAHLSYAIFDYATASVHEKHPASFNRANMTGASFRWARLSGASMIGSILSDANFTETDLVGTDLRGADLSKADLSSAILTGAQLQGVWFKGADVNGQRLTKEQLGDATFTYAAHAGVPVVDPVTLDPHVSAQRVATGFTELACANAAVAEGIIRWVSKSYQDGNDPMSWERISARAILNAFEVRIEADLKRPAAKLTSCLGMGKRDLVAVREALRALDADAALLALSSEASTVIGVSLPPSDSTTTP